MSSEEDDSVAGPAPMEIEPSIKAPFNPADGHPRQCVAHKKTGARCGKYAIIGATVCRFHGGAAGHVRRAAKARIDNAADRMARVLLGMAADANTPHAVRLAAIKDALDRAGLSARQALDVTHELKPYEQILERVARGERPGSGRPAKTGGRVGGEDAYDTDDVLDAELVEDDGGHYCGRCGVRFPDELPAHLDAYPEFCRPCRAVRAAGPRNAPNTPADPLQPAPGPTGARPGEPPPPVGLVTRDEAIRDQRARRPGRARQ